VLYVDTSAAMKLIVAEPGSAELQRWLRPRMGEVFSSDLLRTEFLRAVRRSVPARESLAREILESMPIIRLSVEIYERAALIEPSRLRSLDALHLAAAIEPGVELEGIVTYDDRLAAAARVHGIETVSPR
jgi:hypothetical protein